MSRNNHWFFRWLSPLPQLLALNWGGHCLISLYLSIISGIVLALQYNAAEPFYSAATLELVIPFGSFWRGLHYYSSQAFFFLLLCHFGVVVSKGDHGFTRRAWLRLILSLPIALLLLFTGYILRGDATGAAAGVIAEHLALSLPFLGRAVNSLTFAVTGAGVTKVYANHLITLMALGLFSVWPHLRRYMIRWSDHLGLVVVCGALAIFTVAPMEPDKLGISRILGPWFFVGLQELLRYLPAFWAGIFFPLLLLIALGALPDKDHFRKNVLLFIIGWLMLYGILSVSGFSRT